MTTEQETSTALSVNVLSQIDALDDQQVIMRLTGGLPAVTQRWVYRFPGVVGLSIDGVQEAARALATQGEAIEQVWVHMEDQNENEAYFTACAVRYAVSPEGQRVELDRAIRAKRQPKFTKLRAGGTQFNEFWYEVGIAKALRNAVEALLPEAIKQHMINAAGKAGPARPAAAPGPADDDGISAAVGTGNGQRAAPAASPRATLRTLLTDVKETHDAEFWGTFTEGLRQAFPDAHDPKGLVIAKLTDEQVVDLITKIRQNIIGEPPVPEAKGAPMR